MNLKDMDIVYILGKGSQWRNNELRYSLRSLKNIEHRKVFIIGYLPKFIRTDRVEHIPCTDDTNSKLKNSQKKHRVACDDLRISSKFILMHDDIFFLQEIHKIENLCHGKLGHTIELHPSKAGYYYDAIRMTKTLLELSGKKEPLDLSIHQPFIFDKKKLKKVLDILDGVTTGGLIRTLYGNMFLKDIREAEDVKFTAKTQDFEKMEKMPIISIDDSLALKSGFRFWIDRQFPHPSDYEIENIQDNYDEDCNDNWTTPHGITIDGEFYSPGSIIRNKKLSTEVVKANSLQPA